ncbi:MAG TPA: BlaI/MecI/CopY family transcriptional regulator [Terriglobia bacterium]|nr:BlaI/MecI/CopY family transcriptional regulator [Terriglobia bacterium]
MTKGHHTLSRRERQIMDVLYQRERATAAEVQEGLPDAPSYSAVRALLRILEQKGHIRHEQDKARYVFTPVVNRDKAKISALRHLVQTFFEGSPEMAVAALIDSAAPRLQEDALERILKQVRKARDARR